MQRVFFTLVAMLCMSIVVTSHVSAKPKSRRNTSYNAYGPRYDGPYYPVPYHPVPYALRSFPKRRHPLHFPAPSVPPRQPKHKNALHIAVIGDTPYTEDEIQAFPKFMGTLNSDYSLDRTIHVGDIKTGSTLCDDETFVRIRDAFDSLRRPLIYIPGDNEWTDCHRSKAGKYHPLERLDVLRDVFFPEPGITLGGRKARVLSQAMMPGYASYPENMLWFDEGVVFSTFHIVGSQNNYKPWFDDDTKDRLVDDPVARLAEADARRDAVLEWINTTFAVAMVNDARGVVLLTHADMFQFEYWSSFETLGFTEIVQSMAQLSKEYGKPVLHIEGDSHVYREDFPLANGSVQYGVDFEVPNFQRIVIDAGVTEYLRLTILPKSESHVFEWERIFVE